MPYIPMEKKNQAKRRVRYLKATKRNNVVIIIDAEKDEEYAEIEKELHACVQKLNRRTKELGYCITPKERTYLTRKEAKGMRKTKELLRKQLELLAEQSQNSLSEEMPSIAKAMCEVHRELRHCFSSLAICTCFFFMCANFVISLVIQIEKLFRRKS